MQANNGLGTPCGKSPYEVWLNSRIDFFQSAFKQFTSVKNKMKIKTNLAVLFTRILQISLNSMNLIFAILPMEKQSCTVCSTTPRRRYATKPRITVHFL